MSTISDIITSETNYTKQLQAATDTVTGAASENLKQSDFLALLTEQLQFQDPTKPTDNSQFISQMCQFSQLEATTEMDSTISKYAGETQAESLVGQGVVLKDPDNAKKTISGTVDAAYMNGANSAITVNGTTYPLESLLYSYDAAKTTAASE